MGSHPSVPNTGDESTGPWLYNDLARVVTHAAHSCNICSKWAHHYVSSVVINDATLRKAAEKRNDVIRAPLAAENASLRGTNDSLRRELDAVRADLDATRRKLHDADDKIFRLRRNGLGDVKYHTDNTVTELQTQVKDLRHQIRELECGDTPRRRKLSRCGSYTPSTSLLPSVEPPLPTPAEPSPLAGSDLASRMDGAAPGSVNATPPPQQPASALTHRNYVRTRSSRPIGLPKTLPAARPSPAGSIPALRVADVASHNGVRIIP